MLPIETVAWIVGLVLCVCLGVVFYVFMYRNGEWRPDPLRRTSPIMRGRPTLSLPSYGECEVVSFDDIGDGAAMHFFQDAHGSKHQKKIWDDEIRAKNIRQVLYGPGNPIFEFRPSKARILKHLEMEAAEDRYRTAAIQAREEAEDAKLETKMARTNQKMEVDKRIEQAATLSKSQQQPVVRGR